MALLFQKRVSLTWLNALLCTVMFKETTKLKTRKYFWVSKPLVFHKRGVAAHSVARFLIKQPEALILARVFSRFMAKICAQFSLTIHLMIPLSRDEVFAERLLYSQLRFSFSYQPKHYFHCSTPEVWKYTFIKVNTSFI